MKLTYKIPLIFIGIGFFTLAVSFYISYQEISKGLSQSSFQHLTANRESKVREIEGYFSTINQQLITLSSNLMTLDAVRDFNHAFSRINATPSEQQLEQLKEYYQNDFYTRYKQNSQSEIKPLLLMPSTIAAQQLQLSYLLDSPVSTSALEYDKQHDRYHPIFKQYQQGHGLHDIFLLNVRGDVVYSITKEIDFASNLQKGPLKASALAQVYSQTLQLASAEQTTLVDYTPHVASYGEPALFIASPIEEQGRVLGVLVFQLSIKAVDGVMSNERRWREEGYGETGETYIVSSDYGMRNNSRFFIESPDEYMDRLKQHGVDPGVIENIKNHNTTILFQQIKTVAVEEALSGNRDTKIIDDYRGVPVLSSYAPLAIPGLNWVLISEIDKEEAFTSLANVRKQIMTFAMWLFVILVFMAVVIAKRVTNPLLTLVELAKSISRDDYGKRIPIIKNDEIGQLSQALNEMSSTLEVTTVSSAYVDKILNSMTDALFVLKANSGRFEDLRVQTVNDAAKKILEVESGEIIYRTMNEFMEDGCHLSEEEVTVLVEKGFLESKDKVLLSKSGRKIPVLSSISIMKNDNRAVKGSLLCVCIAKDITDRKKIEEKLKLTSTVFNNSSDPVMILNGSGLIVDVNPSFEQTFVYAREDLQQQAVTKLKSVQESIGLAEVLGKTELKKQWRGEVCLKSKLGGKLPLLLSSSAVEGSGGEVSYYVMLFSDITELKEREQRIRNVANHDSLTGLPNRLLFNDRLQQAINHSHRVRERFAIMFLDLDGFKAVNDNWGHHAGDELLIEVSKRLKSKLRETDTVARLGGDEFVILLANVKAADDYILVANNILDAISQPYQLSNATVQVTTSIGIACYPEHSEEMAALVEMADDAMYKAKKSGKNCMQVAEEVVSLAR